MLSTILSTDRTSPAVNRLFSCWVVTGLWGVLNMQAGSMRLLHAVQPVFSGYSFLANDGSVCSVHSLCAGMKVRKA
jgi:hypothetical protein